MTSEMACAGMAAKAGKLPQSGLEALGATRANIALMVAGQMAPLVAIGEVLGAALGYGAHFRLQQSVSHFPSWEAGVYGAVGSGVLLVSVLAALGPAWKAAQVPPSRALRAP
jgi:predicted lysophospholipase L1 biosynthesis ABC-type transport system permease subunit